MPQKKPDRDESRRDAPKRSKQLYLHEDQAKWLSAYARRTGLSESEILRLALDVFREAPRLPQLATPAA